jgi:hypothetical protein
MNLEKLNHWLTLLANIGVLAGIVFLAIEINQNTNIMKAQTRGSVTDSILTLLQMERNPIVVSGYKKIQAGQDLTFEESYFLENQANATIRQWENSYYQYQSGLFDEAEYSAITVVIKNMMQEPHMTDHWAVRKTTYSKPFRDHIDGLTNQRSGMQE